MTPLFTTGSQIAALKDKSGEGSGVGMTTQMENKNKQFIFF